jgi:hypothetical protein
LQKAIVKWQRLLVMSSSIALGCSHTFGIGVKPEEAWPSLLSLTNLGMPGCSTDYCARLLSEYLPRHSVKEVYIFYPNKYRFEYYKGDKILQSLPSDKNRIQFMDTHDEEWCKKNYDIQTSKIFGLCKKYDALLIDLALEDITGIIDHSDLWPKGTDGDHNGPLWHRWLADLFLVRRSFVQYAKTR